MSTLWRAQKRQILFFRPHCSSSHAALCHITPSQLLPQRSFSQSTVALKKAPSKSTAGMVPGSQLVMFDEAPREEYEKADDKMSKSVEWFRKECAGAETRATGRVTTGILDPVRVTIRGKDKKLDEVATVGVRDGSELLVTLFEDQNTKAVEKALYDAKIPGIVPQRMDGRTIKIPVPKPTVESRLALYTAAHKKAEEIRVGIRKQHQLSVKKFKFSKHEEEWKEFQKLEARHIAAIDKILQDLKKATGAK